MISTKYDERGFYIATVDGHETPFMVRIRKRLKQPLRT